jgi:hypothetical protein
MRYKLKTLYLDGVKFPDHGEGVWRKRTSKDMYSPFEFKVKVSDLKQFDCLEQEVAKLANCLSSVDLSSTTQFELETKSLEELSYRQTRPVYDEERDMYRVIRPLNLVTSSRELGFVFFHQLFPATTSGVSTGEDLEDKTANIQCHLECTDVGRIYCVAEYINFT